MVRNLFTARHRLDGVTEYISRVTGNHFLVYPDGSGYAVDSQGLQLTMFTSSKAQAMRLIELSDI